MKKKTKKKTKKRMTWLWISVGFVITVCLSTIVGLFVFSFLEKKENGPKREVRTVLYDAMDSMIGEEGENEVIIGKDGTLLRGFKNTGSAFLLSQKMIYNIQSLKVDKEQAEAVLEITTPDGPAVLHQAVDEIEELSEDVLYEKLEEILEDEYEERVFTVKVEFVKQEGQWYLVQNDELLNALSGGLLEEYIQLRQKSIDQWKEEVK